MYKSYKVEINNRNNLKKSIGVIRFREAARLVSTVCFNGLQ